MSTPRFFATPAAWRAWLAKHHTSEAELSVGFYRKDSGRKSITWPESVDEALCFGWIDGVRHRIDDEAYRIRFTPRRKGSIWSAVNIRRATELIAEGRMAAAGLAAFEARTDDRSNVYAYENRPESLPVEYETALRTNRAAWAFWTAQPAGWRRTTTWWIVSAKQDATRQRRLAMLVEHAAAGRRVR